MGRGRGGIQPPAVVRPRVNKFYQEPIYRFILSQIIELFINWIFVCKFENVYVL